MARKAKRKEHKGWHIAKPMAALVVLFGLLVLGSTYYLAGETLITAQRFLGIATFLAGAVLWYHHAGEKK
ncbi:MAG: hypothetical protein QXF55_02420 [Candidatus Aenigmatarchaeota archaeon]